VFVRCHVKLCHIKPRAVPRHSSTTLCANARVCARMCVKLATQHILPTRRHISDSLGQTHSSDLARAVLWSPCCACLSSFGQALSFVHAASREDSCLQKANLA